MDEEAMIGLANIKRLVEQRWASQSASQRA